MNFCNITKWKESVAATRDIILWLDLLLANYCTGENKE
jgi:hypothetical protein